MQRIISDRSADPYSWMRDPTAPEFARHVTSQNKAFDEAMAPAMPLAHEIYDEIIGRLPRVDATVPYRYGSYGYSFQYVEDRESPRFLRRRADSAAEPEVLLDYEDFRGGGEYLDVQVCIDRQSTLLAIAVDVTGDRIYSLQFRDLVSQRDLSQRISLATGNMAWCPNTRILFYSELDPETLRWRRIRRYAIGSDPSSAETVFDETDDAFSCSVYLAKSERFILIPVRSGNEDEVRYIAADPPFAPPRVLQSRQTGLEYSVDHDGSSFVIRTNLGHYNFSLMTASPETPSSENWVEL